MSSIVNHDHDDNDEDEDGDNLASDSTIHIEFSESIAQKRTASYNDNKNTLSSSFQRNQSRKRSTSEENYPKKLNEKEHFFKKQCSSMKSRTFLSHNQNQQLYPTESMDSIANQQDNDDPMSLYQFHWFQEFMKQSLDTIREAVVKTCMNALSSHSIIPLNINPAVQDIHRNNHLIGCSQSDNSCTSYKSQPSLQTCRLKSPPLTKERNRLLLIQKRYETNDEHGDKKPKIHQRARTSPYPSCKNAFRALVDETQVPWSYEWPHYKPTIFTAEEIYINPGADPDLLKSSSSSISLHFNAIDGAVDRRSVYQHYHVGNIDGLPLNPIGRTGLQGRGSLLRWGPNIYHYVMICRWKRDMNGTIRLHPSNGKRILEILLEIQTDGSETLNFILTGGLKMLGSRFPPQLQDRLRRFTAHTDSMIYHRKALPSTLDRLGCLFEQNPIPWKGAYFDDARNTDNAWIELYIEYYLDSDHLFTTCIPNFSLNQLKSIEQPRFVWKEVSNAIHIGPRTHYRLIKNLAYKLNAYF